MVETRDKPGTPTEAKVDYVLDENASPIELAEDTSLRAATNVEQAVGATGPSNWSRLGILALGAVVLVLLVFQFMNGGAQTGVVPGTPTVAPAEAPPVTTTPATDAP
jgi:hypothetical protein